MTAGGALIIEFDDTLNFVGPRRIHVHLLLVGFREKDGILHQAHERRAQCAQSIRRRVRRGGEGAGNSHVRRQERQNLPVFLVLRQLEHQGHVLEVRRAGQADLHQNMNLLLGNPMGMIALPRSPGVRAAAADLAALHGEVDLVSSRISADDAKLCSKNLVHGCGVDVTRRRDARCADDQFLRKNILDARYACRVPGIDHVGAVGRVSEPAEASCIELNR